MTRQLGIEGRWLAVTLVDVLAPVSCEDEASVQGLVELRATLAKLSRLCSTDPHLTTLLTRWAPGRVLSGVIDAAVAELGFPALARVPARAAVGQAGAQHIPLALAAPDSCVTIAYERAPPAPTSTYEPPPETPTPSLSPDMKTFASSQANSMVTTLTPCSERLLDRQAPGSVPRGTVTPSRRHIPVNLTAAAGPPHPEPDASADQEQHPPIYLNDTYDDARDADDIVEAGHALIVLCGEDPVRALAPRGPNDPPGRDGQARHGQDHPHLRARPRPEEERGSSDDHDPDPAPASRRDPRPWDLLADVRRWASTVSRGS